MKDLLLAFEPRWLDQHELWLLLGILGRRLRLPVLVIRRELREHHPGDVLGILHCIGILEELHELLEGMPVRIMVERPRRLRVGGYLAHVEADRPDPDAIPISLGKDAVLRATTVTRGQKLLATHEDLNLVFIHLLVFRSPRLHQATVEPSLEAHCGLVLLDQVKQLRVVLGSSHRGLLHRGVSLLDFGTILGAGLVFLRWRHSLPTNEERPAGCLPALRLPTPGHRQPQGQSQVAASSAGTTGRDTLPCQERGRLHCRPPGHGFT
mmetsp:Transcript_61739/g.139344  ORF Transcript_61739/g.139344 Transcript_61739/m.139344 type:complete len:266 (+) Transcript_61739:1134-1931(+)